MCMHRSINDFAPDYVRKRLEYDSYTGVLRWKAKPEVEIADKVWNSKKAGNIAGSLYDGEWYVFLDGEPCRASRLCWTIAHAKKPLGEVLHRDGDILNNRITNLGVYSPAPVDTAPKVIAPRPPKVVTPKPKAIKAPKPPKPPKAVKPPKPPKPEKIKVVKTPNPNARQTRSDNLADEQIELVRAIYRFQDTGTVSRKGREVGHWDAVKKRQYVQICELGIRIRKEVLLWILAYGRNVAGVLRHIDKDTSNNSLDNLREDPNTLRLSSSQSIAKNGHRKNKVGCVGVSYCKANKLWIARTSNRGERIDVGRYKTAEEAIEAMTAYRANLSIQADPVVSGRVIPNASSEVSSLL